MRFLRAFAIGLITAVVGMFLAIFASDYLTRLYHVPDMEGQLLARKTKSGPTGHWQRSAQILLLFPRLKKSPFAIASARLAFDPVTAV